MLRPCRWSASALAALSFLPVLLALQVTQPTSGTDYDSTTQTLPVAWSTQPGDPATVDIVLLSSGAPSSFLIIASGVETGRGGVTLAIDPFDIFTASDYTISLQVPAGAPQRADGQTRFASSPTFRAEGTSPEVGIGWITVTGSLQATLDALPVRAPSTLDELAAAGPLVSAATPAGFSAPSPSAAAPSPVVFPSLTDPSDDAKTAIPVASTPNLFLTASSPGPPLSAASSPSSSVAFTSAARVTQSTISGQTVTPVPVTTGDVAPSSTEEAIGPDDGHQGGNRGMIAGIVVGVFLAISILALLIYRWHHKRGGPQQVALPIVQPWSSDRRDSMLDEPESIVSYRSTQFKMIYGTSQIERPVTMPFPAAPPNMEEVVVADSRPPSFVVALPRQPVRVQTPPSTSVRTVRPPMRDTPRLVSLTSTLFSLSAITTMAAPVHQHSPVQWSPTATSEWSATVENAITPAASLPSESRRHSSRTFGRRKSVAYGSE